MKKIRCNLCNGVWFVEEESLERQNTCPYCSVSIQYREEPELNSLDSLDKIIYTAVHETGEEVLQDPGKLYEVMVGPRFRTLSSENPKLEKEIHILGRVLTDNCSNYLRDLFVQSKENAKGIIAKLKRLFIEEEGLSDNWADIICDALYGAAMYYHGHTRLNNVTVEDFLADNHAQPEARNPFSDSTEARAAQYIESDDATEQNRISEDGAGVIRTKDTLVYRCLGSGYVIIRGLNDPSNRCPMCKRTFSEDFAKRHSGRLPIPAFILDNLDTLVVASKDDDDAQEVHQPSTVRNVNQAVVNLLNHGSHRGGTRDSYSSTSSFEEARKQTTRSMKRITSPYKCGHCEYVIFASRDSRIGKDKKCPICKGSLQLIR